MEVYEAYNHLKEIVTKGYITLGISYKGFNIVLKSLTTSELDYLKIKNNVRQFDDIPILDRLIYSTHFLNGVNFINKRKGEHEDLGELLSQLPVNFLRKIAQISDDLFIKFIESSEFLEGFCYTSDSSVLWKVFRASRYRNSGYGGSLDIIDNSVRDRWVMVNEHLEEEKEEELRMGHALFIASAFNPKGIKSASNSIKAKKEEKEKEREDLAKHGFSKRRVAENSKGDKWSKPLITSEDLVRELGRALRGEKDKHDLFIDEWMRRKDEAARKKQEEKDAASEAFRKNFEETSLDTEGTRKASPDDLAKILDISNGKGPSLSSYSSAYEDVGKSESLMKRIGSRILKNEE